MALLAVSDDQFGLVMGRNSDIVGSNPGQVGYSSPGLCMYNAQFEGAVYGPGTMMAFCKPQICCEPHQKVWVARI